MDVIVTGVSRSARHTFSRPPAERIRLITGLGVEGDAHMGVTVRHRSRRRWGPAGPDLRQVHPLHAELQRAAPPPSCPLPPETGRGTIRRPRTRCGAVPWMASSLTARHIFVYGTLLSSFAGGDNPTMQGRARMVDSGSIPGLLVDNGEYPAAVPDAESPGRIRGEVHVVSVAGAPELLEVLDRYEGYFPQRPAASLFVRERVTVSCDGGEQVSARTYRYNRSVNRLPMIPDGDYPAYRNRMRTNRRFECPIH